MVRRLAHLIWGVEVDRALRPVLLVTLIDALAGSSVWSFMGIWALKELGATSSQLGYGYLLVAISAGIVGYIAGHLSDHFARCGRRAGDRDGLAVTRMQRWPRPRSARIGEATRA